MMLHESALKEMGVNLVGPRTLVLKELKRLKAEQRFAVREAVLWEDNQWDDPKDYLKHHRTGSQEDHYLFTGSNLVVTRTHQSTCFGLHTVTACCGCCCCCCWNETYHVPVKELDEPRTHHECGFADTNTTALLFCARPRRGPREYVQQRERRSPGRVAQSWAHVARKPR